MSKYFYRIFFLPLLLSVTSGFAQFCFDVPKENFYSGKPTIISNIRFEFNKPTLDTTSFACLHQLVDFLKQHDSLKINVRVHTDTRSAETQAKYSWKVTESRAKSIVDYLQQGIQPERLKCTGMGNTEPLIPDSNIVHLKSPEEIERAHATNRRCDFIISCTNFKN